MVTQAGSTETERAGRLRLRRSRRSPLPAGGHRGRIGLPGGARRAALPRAPGSAGLSRRPPDSDASAKADGREYTGISLVTGATGFLGRHLVAHLVQRGVQVRAAALPSEDTRALAQLGVEVVRADLTAPDTLPPLFAGDVDRVFHLGAICNFSTPYSVLRRVNVEGVERITALARAAGVRAFVHMSSTSVYGPYRGDAVRRERAPRSHKTTTGAASATARTSSGSACVKGFPPSCCDRAPCTVPAAPTAPARCSRARRRSARSRATAGSGSPTCGSKTSPPRPYHLSLREDAVGQAFNVADDSHPSIEEALTLAAEAFGDEGAAAASAAGRRCGWRRAYRGSRRGCARRIPDLEADAVRYLCADYVVDNAKLKATRLSPALSRLRRVDARDRPALSGGDPGMTDTDRRGARCRSW